MWVLIRQLWCLSCNINKYNMKVLLLYNVFVRHTLIAYQKPVACRCIVMPGANCLFGCIPRALFFYLNSPKLTFNTNIYWMPKVNTDGRRMSGLSESSPPPPPVSPFCKPLSTANKINIEFKDVTSNVINKKN